jgi:hypothetical protein
VWDLLKTYLIRGIKVRRLNENRPATII